jgi:hypothetical protein
MFAVRELGLQLLAAQGLGVSVASVAPDSSLP